MPHVITQWETMACRHDDPDWKRVSRLSTMATTPRSTLGGLFDTSSNSPPPFLTPTSIYSSTFSSRPSPSSSISTQNTFCFELEDTQVIRRPHELSAQASTDTNKITVFHTEVASMDVPAPPAGRGPRTESAAVIARVAERLGYLERELDEASAKLTITNDTLVVSCETIERLKITIAEQEKTIKKFHNAAAHSQAEIDQLNEEVARYEQTIHNQSSFLNKHEKFIKTLKEQLKYCRLHHIGPPTPPKDFRPSTSSNSFAKPATLYSRPKSSYSETGVRPLVSGPLPGSFQHIQSPTGNPTCATSPLVSLPEAQQQDAARRQVSWSREKVRRQESDQRRETRQRQEGREESSDVLRLAPGVPAIGDGWSFSEQTVRRRMVPPLQQDQHGIEMVQKNMSVFEKFFRKNENE